MKLPTLEVVLGIDLRRITPKEQPGMEVTRQIFQALGRPTEIGQIYNFCEKAMIECERIGVYYPKVILSIRRQIREKTWAQPVLQETLEITPPKGKCPDCLQEYDGLANLEAWLRLHHCPNRPQQALMPDVRKKVVGG